MRALSEDMHDPAHPGECCLVLADRADARGLDIAGSMGLATACVEYRAFGADRGAFEAALGGPLAAAGAELLCLAGFMRVLTPSFVAAWAGRMLNIHPSILPLFPGLDTHARALAAGVAVHGATVHEVTADLDAGPILGQAVLPVRSRETPAALAARVLALEHRLYPAVLRRFATGDRGALAMAEGFAADGDPR